MKTILVPTDYSEVADNALKYAIELARFSQAKLILMHAYQVPMPTGEIPIMMISPQQFEEENRMRIENLARKIDQQTRSEVKTESTARAGFTVEEIQNVIKEKNPDLVVMGITGAGEISERLMGSYTTSLIKKTQTPVLVVPKEARYQEVKKMVLAYDYNEVVNIAALERFKKFAKLFDAKVLVLDVEKPVVIPVYEDTVAGEALENSLKDIEHVMFFSPSEDMTEEINTFADFHKCDWIAMIPHKHNLLSQLFHESNTKRMAFHTHIPLLSIHD